MYKKDDTSSGGTKLLEVKPVLFDQRLLGKFTSTSGAEVIPQRPDLGPAPVSFMQQRLWFLDQLQPGSSAYNIYEVVHLTGLLDRVALEQSLNEIVKRHEVLRTTIPTRDSQPAQAIAPEMTLELRVVDLQAMPDLERVPEARRLARVEVQQPFDLAQGPLLRVALIQLAQKEQVLVLTMHQIICDRWSKMVFFKEVATLYTAFSTGKPSPLAELPIQYADFTLWQRQWLESEVGATKLAYWKQQLASAPAMLELPTDRPRPPVQTFRGARQSLVISRPLSQALLALSQRENVTLFMTMLAAFKTLLYRYTGQDDILVGSPIANRKMEEVWGLIGLFVNTLVLRTNLAGDPTFREVLRQVKQVTQEAYINQDIPFEKLVEELAPRHLSHTPLFQVMFICEQEPLKPQQFSDLLPTRWDCEGEAKFDLTLAIEAGEFGLRGTLEYNSDLFEAATITRMLGHWQTLLEAIAADPDQRLSLLPLLRVAEQEQILSAWNSTASDKPSSRSIVDLFEAQVAKHPGATAFKSNGEELSYQELNRRANQIAHYLQTLGVGPEVVVGICLERSLDLAVSLLGVLKAGGVYLPLDPSYPQSRLAFMFENAQAAVLVTQKHLAALLPTANVRVVCLDADGDEIARHQANPISPGITPSHLAYIIYTSGSTGKPKGVGVEHRQLLNRFAWMWKEYPFEPGEVCCQNTALNFVDSLWELLGPLLQGVPIVIIPQRVLQEPQALVQVLAAHRVTRIWVVPSLLRLLLDTYPDLQQQLLALKFWAVGGEALSVDLLQRFGQLMPHSRLYNLYGTSEVWDATCYTSSDLDDELWHVPIGRPISNVQVYVLSPYLQPMPIGAPGELYIGGIGLGRGYLNQPALTTEKFIPNPFSQEPGARLYKTGDLARYLPDGNVEYLGRIDHQVKIRGFRIEPGEIETALHQHPGVQQAVVMVREDVSVEKCLVAYVVLQLQPAPTVGELRRFLLELLPEYMVPSAFVFLHALPLTPNGKVDRRALPTPNHLRPELELAFVAPRDALETQLTTIWEEVLGIQPIGVKDNFFEMGGHSLLAVRLFAQIEKIFCKNLPLATLFQAPTVEQQANILLHAEWSAHTKPLVKIQSGDSQPPLFSIHGGYSSVLMFYNLARYLGDKQPVYGLQPQGLDGQQIPHTRIEDMAADYIREIRTVQPQGPYFLGGFSMGGKVAYEMAQQLHAQGQKVAMLVLFDTPGPGWLRPLPVAARVSIHLGNLLRLKPKEKLTYIQKKLNRRFYSDHKQPLPKVHYISPLQEAHEQADEDYVPQVYPGRAILFRAIDPFEGWLDWCSVDPELGWGKLVAGGLEVHEVPGNHMSMFTEPYIRVLAEKLRACLDSALAAD